MFKFKEFNKLYYAYIYIYITYCIFDMGIYNKKANNPINEPAGERNKY